MKNKTTGFIGGKFLPLHQGHLSAMMTASDYVDELYVVLTSSKKRDKYLCKKERFPYIDAKTRLSWLGEELSEFDNIKIIHIEDEYGLKNYDWDKESKKIKKAIGKKIDYVFSSEQHYDEYFKKNYADAKHLVIDETRSQVPISATQIRKNLYKHFYQLPGSVQQHFTKKVAIVGTESCGKSTLVKKLAKHYNTQYVQETGRDFCEKYKNELTQDHFLQIAMTHYLAQQKAANKILFIDTEATITQYYAKMYLDKKFDIIDQIAKLTKYDLVLYLKPDVKWVDDGFRFLEENREQNDEYLKKMFEKNNVKLVEISGDYKTRFRKSKEEVDRLLKKTYKH